MLDLLKERKAALEARGKKGFTLMEMLIVIAIIAILIAIAIPIFSGQLENAREATDKANLRSAYSEVITAYLNDGKAHKVGVKAEQQQGDAWESGDAEIGSELQISGTGSSTGTGAQALKPAPSTEGWTVAINDKGEVSVSVGLPSTSASDGGNQG